MASIIPNDWNISTIISSRFGKFIELGYKSLSHSTYVPDLALSNYFKIGWNGSTNTDLNATIKPSFKQTQLWVPRQILLFGGIKKIEETLDPRANKF